MSEEETDSEEVSVHPALQKDSASDVGQSPESTAPVLALALSPQQKRMVQPVLEERASSA